MYNHAYGVFGRDRGDEATVAGRCRWRALRRRKLTALRSCFEDYVVETWFEQPWQDTMRVWWNVSAMLVIVMQLGFICLEMGCVRPHNRAGIAVKNFMMLHEIVLVKLKI